jgi:hypothetical protein
MSLKQAVRTNIRDSYRSINEFKKGYQPRTNFIKDWNSVQNLLPSHLHSKNMKLKIYRTIIFPVVLYGWETWSLT